MKTGLLPVSVSSLLAAHSATAQPAPADGVPPTPKRPVTDVYCAERVF